MAEHKFLFSLVVLSSFMSLAWILIIYVLSFHAARRLVDKITVDYATPRHELRRSAYAERAYRCHSLAQDRAYHGGKQVDLLH